MLTDNRLRALMLTRHLRKSAWGPATCSFSLASRIPHNGPRVGLVSGLKSSGNKGFRMQCSVCKFHAVRRVQGRGGVLRDLAHSSVPTFCCEGCRESRRCSRNTYPESYTTWYTSMRRKPDTSIRKKTGILVHEENLEDRDTSIHRKQVHYYTQKTLRECAGHAEDRDHCRRPYQPLCTQRKPSIQVCKENQVN